jgi:hypothetical protein
MNERILAIYRQSHTEGYLGKAFDPEKFVELIKQAIYDDVKQDLIEDSEINIEPDSPQRQYLKGCNGGVTDALYRIKMFGVDEEEQ